MEYIVNCGDTLTTDVFILPSNVYCRLVKTDYHIIKHFDSSTFKEVNYNVYLCWNYETGLKRFITFDEFNVQFKAYCLFKTHDDFQDCLIQEILDKDLFEIAAQSEHMF